DVRFVAFGVAFLDLHDVGDDASVLALWELVDERATGLGIVAPAVGARILSRGIPHIAGLGIDHVGKLHARTAAELVGQGRGRGRHDFIFAGGEDEGIVASATWRTTCGGRKAERRRWRVGFAALVDHRSTGTEPVARRRHIADTPAGEADADIDFVLEIVAADDAVGRHAALAVA